MKLYDNPHAPNPRRVRMVLAEKGIAYDREELDLGAGENLKAEFCAKNPFAKVPVLELDDGLCLSETPAICRYLDEVSEEGSLFGTTPKERAIIDMWEHRIRSGVINRAIFNACSPSIATNTVYPAPAKASFIKARDSGVSSTIRIVPEFPVAVPGLDEPVSGLMVFHSQYWTHQYYLVTSEIEHPGARSTWHERQQNGTMLCNA